jgi:hypothetical protein
MPDEDANSPPVVSVLETMPRQLYLLCRRLPRHRRLREPRIPIVSFETKSAAHARLTARMARFPQRFQLSGNVAN